MARPRDFDGARCAEALHPRIAEVYCFIAQDLAGVRVLQLGTRAVDLPVDAFLAGHAIHVGRIASPDHDTLLHGRDDARRPVQAAGFDH